MFIILSALSIALFVSLKNIVYNPIDKNLLSKAEALDAMVDESIDSDFKFSFSDTKGNSFQFNVSKGRMWIYSSQYSKYFFQIRSFDGKTVKKSISLGDNDLPFKHHLKKIETIQWKGKILRILNYVDDKNKIVVQVAYNAKNEKDILDNFMLIAFVLIIFVMFASAVGGFIVSKKALSPIDRISERIRKITEENLSGEIELENAPDELKVLIESFNDMLKRLDKSFKQKKRFISDVSHELKTPVSVIMMQSEIVLRKQRSADEYKKAFSVIYDTASMMSTLIERMLLMARLDYKRNKMKFEDVDICDIVENAINLLKHKAEEKGVDVLFEKGDVFYVKVDTVTMLEVFVNLLDNAIKYNNKNGYVRINVKSDEEWVVVEMSDNGVGISEEELEKIDEEFYRIDESRSKKTTGFGLGLSIVKKIIEIHEGKLVIKSKVDKGTTVSVFLKKSS